MVLVLVLVFVYNVVTFVQNSDVAKASHCILVMVTDECSLRYPNIESNLGSGTLPPMTLHLCARASYQDILPR
ncbi:hypothetical protein QQP08_009726 [Theobroma cacao]|nr:hypothetical protein QQP08_009726 [Theobroma cacao]